MADQYPVSVFQKPWSAQGDSPVYQMNMRHFPVLLCLLAGVIIVLPRPAWPETDTEQGLMAVDCPGRLIFNKESLSRSGICIRLDRAGERCRIKGRVGGEHISYVGIKGRPGGRYKIRFTPVMGKPDYSVRWPAGVGIAPGSRLNIKILTPPAESGVILSLSAHPFGEYELLVERLTMTESSSP
ncbi:MAG: hypothetical protein HUN04_11835 [Desulfobacter sp.]|nr:MAG: hypothetical protein HUN04_11835 [Desulfobacter sp.]